MGKVTELLPNGKKSVACSVIGCNNRIKAKTFCALHYARFRRTGDTATIRRSGRIPDEGFTVWRRMFTELSPRTISRLFRAYKLWRDYLQDCISWKEIIERCSRPNGSLNISRVEELVESIAATTLV